MNLLSESARFKFWKAPSMRNPRAGGRSDFQFAIRLPGRRHVLQEFTARNHVESTVIVEVDDERRF